MVPDKRANKCLAKQGMFIAKGHVFMYQIHHNEDETSYCWSFFIKSRKNDVIWQFHRFSKEILD